MIHNILDHSKESPRIRMSDEMWDAFLGIRKYMFEHLYTNEIVKAEEKKAAEIIKILYEYYI